MSKQKTADFFSEKFRSDATGIMNCHTCDRVCWGPNGDVSSGRIAKPPCGKRPAKASAAGLACMREGFARAQAKKESQGKSSGTQFTRRIMEGIAGLDPAPTPKRDIAEHSRIAQTGLTSRYLFGVGLP